MKVLFYIAKIYSIPVIEPLQAHFSAQGVTCGFYVSSRVFSRLPAHWRQQPVFRELKAAADFCPDYVIVPGNFVDHRLPGRKVQIFHGIGIEKASHYKIRHFFDMYCTSGPAVTEVYRKLQERWGYFLVEETGWPKIDWIVNYPAKGIRERLGIPQNKKVILYAPTFSRKMESAGALLPGIRELLKDDYLWIVKFHELMDASCLDVFTGSDAGRVRVVDIDDITPYLHAADVMVSDTSSVVYEFMALDKPVITCRTLKRKDKGIDIDSPEQLRPALERSFADPSEYQLQRRRHLSEVNPRCDGSISHRLLALLRELKEENRWPNRKMPLNLFRKTQVHYHSRFKKGYLR